MRSEFRLGLGLGLVLSATTVVARLAFSLFLLTSVPVASAQDPEPDGDAPTERPTTSSDEPLVDRELFEDEVLVTARRREENLQQVPLSVVSFDTDTLEQAPVQDLSDLSELAANLDFSVSGGLADGTTSAVVMLRGIGQVDTAVFSDPGVGIYLDGVYLSRAQSGVLDLLDVDRVEVLRGPQGTLFGKNTTGGAIQVIARRPGPELGGRAGLTLGRFDRTDARFSIDVPWSPTLRSSLAIKQAKTDGWSRSLTTGQRFHDNDRRLARAATHWQPSNGFSALWSVDLLHDRGTGGHQILLGTRPTPLLNFYNRVLAEQGLPTFDIESWGTESFDQTFALHESFLNREAWGTSLDIQWLWSGVMLRSLTAYRTFELASASDGDASPNVVAERNLEQNHYQFSQELLFSGTATDNDLEWQAGVLYFRERPREVSVQRVLGDLFPALESAPGAIFSPPGVPEFFCQPGPPPFPLPCFGGAGNPFNLLFFSGSGLRQDLDLETRSLALFGELSWPLTDRLSLNVGGRWTEDKKHLAYLATDAFGNVTSDLFNSDSWRDETGRIGLAFQATPTLLAYTSVAKGFKSGGFNGRPQQRQLLDAFDPETAVSYEVGFKKNAFQHRVRLNAALFHTDYDDIQFAASVDVGGQPVFITQNAGDAEIQGFELEGRLSLGTGLHVTASVGHLESEILRVDPRVPSDTVNLGNRLPKSPRWSYALSLQSAHSWSGHGTVIARLDYSWKDKIFQDFANVEAIAQDDLGLLGARLLFAPTQAPWEVAIFGSNLTDESYLESGFNTGAFGLDIGVAGRPREWGIEATWRF